MNARHLTALGVAALVAVIAAFFSTSVREPAQDVGATAAMLVPGLKAGINEVTEVRIAKAGDQPVVTLARGEDHWRVAEQHGYIADTGKIRKLLLDLADARLREQKTSNPDNYHHLGLQDIGKPDATGVQISFAGIEAAPVIVGKAATDAGEATYARVAGASESWLVSGRIDVARDALDWLNRDILDLPSTRIQSVTVRHPDGGQLRISKAQRSDAQFTVEAVPADRELSSPGVANPMGSVLQGLRLDGVVPAAEAEMTEPVITEYRTFEGLVITVQSQPQEDNKALISLKVAFDDALARQFLPPADEFVPVNAEEPAETEIGEPDSASGEAEAQSADSESTELPSFTGAMEEAQALDARLSPWAFSIPGYKHQQMARRMDDLLKAVE